MSHFKEPRNFLLRRLSSSLQKKVLDEAEYVHLDLREKIIEPNKPIKYIEFPETGVLSITQPMGDDVIIEVATVGNEGMIGLPVVMGVFRVGELAICQVEGACWQIESEKFRELFNEFVELQALCLRYSVVYSDQVSRNLGCNRKHNLEQRCARWLLMTHDRCGHENEFSLTQEFLAAMLGVSRTGVNLAAGMLSKANLISYARGKIRILDRKGLEALSCQCYFQMTDYFNKTMGELPVPLNLDDGKSSD